MKRLIFVGALAAAAAVFQSKWLVLAFIAALLGVFVYGIFEVTD